MLVLRTAGDLEPGTRVMHEETQCLAYPVDRAVLLVSTAGAPVAYVQPHAQVQAIIEEGPTDEAGAILVFVQNGMTVEVVS